ncbi:MAG: alpha/beta hydrolase [Pseudomonadota bacterium]
MMLETTEIETGDHPGASIIVLHGLGADGSDFFPLAEELDLTPIGPTRFVFPDAPTRPVTVNGGHVMRAWYDIIGNDDLTRREDETGLRTSQTAIEVLIARERARGIPAARIVIAGFSQGCAMALQTGLRHPERLAGILGMSGYLPLLDKTSAELHEANLDTPIFLAHGLEDSVVHFGRATSSRDTLKALGYDLEWHQYPMGHSVCPQEITDLNRWLVRVLS